MKVLDATAASYAYGSYQYLSIIILFINLKVAMTLLRIDDLRPKEWLRAET